MDFALIKVDNRPTGGIPPTDAVAVCIENIVRPSNAVPHVSAVVKWFNGTVSTESVILPMVLVEKWSGKGSKNY